MSRRAAAAAALALCGAPGAAAEPVLLNYPPAAAAAGEHGSAVIAFVDAAGGIESCRVVRSSGSAALDAASCARFEFDAAYLPRRDAAGRPAQGAGSSVVHWLIPGTSRPASSPAIERGHSVALLDPNEARVASRPRRLSSDFSGFNYPGSLADGGMYGRTMMILHVGARGRVSRCELVQSSGHAALDQATCRMARRGIRFEPARDAAGRAMPSVDLLAMEWTGLLGGPPPDDY